LKIQEANPIPFPHQTVHSGATTLTNQSLCPFKAFATARLAAESWDRAEHSLTAKQRGMLLHAVLSSVWSGPSGGIRSLEDLLSLADRRSFVARHVRLAFNEKIGRALQERLPQSYLALEEERLTGLVTEWLDYEATRLDFVVAGTEVPRSIGVAGLSFKVRLDRIDKLIDGSLLIIDYKTGLVTPKVWALPRPEDVQLPLYAGFALNADEALGGLVFARLRPGDACFAGSVFNPSATLFDGLKGNSTHVKNKLTNEQLSAWQQRIEALAHDFVAGKAEVDPRQNPLACDRCELQVLCRIQERPDRGQWEADDVPEDEETDE
jgi:ATP-dependent helicase/DNAse subunit B